MGNVSRKTSDEASPSVHGQCLDFIHRDDRYQLYDEAKDIGRLRTAALYVGNDHSQTLRSRLNWSLHRIRLADGTPLDTVLAFDPQSVTEARLLLAAMWMVEQQRWEEVAEVLRWASHCGRCTLPVNLTAADINKHADKTAYMSLPRVVTQLMVVGRHVDFADSSRLELFRHGHEVRAINDEPDFDLEVDPPLFPDHPYRQHRLQDDPPVRSHIHYWERCGIWRSGGRFTDASVSSCAKRLILDHFDHTHKTYRTWRLLDRYVGGGRLDALLSQSPHTPVAGCSTTFSRQHGRPLRYLVLTKSTHNFVAWIHLGDYANIVEVSVWTTEAPVSGEGGAFKDRFPQTTALARVVLEAVGPHVFDGQQPPQQPQPQPQQQGGDDSDDDDEDGVDESEGDDYGDDDDGDVGGGDDDDDDMDPNDGQEGNGGSDEYSEFLGREGPSEKKTVAWGVGGCIGSADRGEGSTRHRLQQRPVQADQRIVPHQ
ncbi:unnamed protein product [Vitrella brassicaformis CCMP3155]|uniref:Uncharacterized protein n=1 Tax=Vitrella brassicaformis (strain CCMP3155) TaxID=1169540 RepID=A0A0G4FLQ4_VITBC|nr:unnamed protein product [Vitrella brassicaformis CCMP3155]|eukprot:CEM14851.1 unnamed protein product [Vitrella brassicaformis CCMP3155]